MPFMVNGRKIDDYIIAEEIERMRPQYNAMFKDQSHEEREQQLLEWARENLIERALIHQEAQKDRRPVSKEEIDKNFKKLVDMNGSEAKLLANTGLSKSDVIEELNMQLRVERLMETVCRDLHKPSEKEIKRHYDSNVENYMSLEQVHAAHIVKNIDSNKSSEDAEREIAEIHAKLKAGDDFEKCADKYSDCPGNGGDLGYFTRGKMVDGFENVVFSMKKNEISEVFKTEFGYHIAKVYDVKPRAPMPMDQVRDTIVNKLEEEKRTSLIESFLDDLRGKAEVVDLPPERATNIRERKRNAPDDFVSEEKQTQKPLNSILVKPAGPDCNLTCGYCFYLEKSELFHQSTVHRMSLETLEEMTRQAMASEGNYISFGWQGGEPTLMGLQFFQQAVDLQQKFGKGIAAANGLQTNGILIDSKWANFLKENSFLVGLSLDGPEHIHDHYRLTAGGHGSWQKVTDSAKLLLDSGALVNALTVVNDYSVQYPEEIYNFHKELGLNHHQYIPCVETDPAAASKAASYSVSPKAYGDFLCKIFDLWRTDFNGVEATVSVRDFDSVFYHYVGMTPPDCTLLPECGVYVVVEHNGDVYACDFFVEPEWKLGNISDGNLQSFLNSEKQKEFGKMKSGLHEDCKRCQWLKYCHGGCTKDRVRNPADHQLSHLCQSYKMFYEHADNSLKQIAAEWQKNQSYLAKRESVIQAVKRGEITVGRNDMCPCGSGNKFKKCCGAEGVH